MKFDRVRPWLGLPALVVGCVLALGTVAGWFGFGVRTPASDFSRLERLQSEYKTHADSVHEATTDVLFHMEEARTVEKGMTEALLVRVCLRDDYEELVLQRLIETCRELGVDRVRGSQGVRAATRAAADSSGGP